MSSSTAVVSFPVPSIAAGPQSIVAACEDAELSGADGAAGSEPRFVEVRCMCRILVVTTIGTLRRDRGASVDW